MCLFSSASTKQLNSLKKKVNVLLVKPSQLLSALDIWLAVLKHTHAQKRRTLAGHLWQHLDDSVLTKHKKKTQNRDLFSCGNRWRSRWGGPAGAGRGGCRGFQPRCRRWRGHSARYLQQRPPRGSSVIEEHIQCITIIIPNSKSHTVTRNLSEIHPLRED